MITLANKHALYKPDVHTGGGSKSSTQQSLDDLTGKPVSQVKALVLSNGIVDWITEDCRPLSIVEDGGLKRFLKVALGNSSYEMPSRKTMF